MRRQALLLLLVVVVSALALVVELERGFTDLEVYRFGGRAVLDDVPLYVAADPSTGLPFTYPPFAALLMIVPAWLPAWLAATLWAGASVLALAGTIALVLAEAGDRVTPAPVAGLCALGLAFEPVWQNVGFGQVNLFLMLLITVDLLRPDRRWAGVLIGVAAGVKLTPLVFVVLLLLVGRRLPAARAAGTFLATVAVGLLVLPASATAYWTDVLWDPSRVGGVAFASNQSINGLLARLLDAQAPTLLWMAVTAPVSLAVLGLAAAHWRRGARDLGLCLGAVSMLLASPITWSHHWVWAVPTALVLLRYASSAARWVAGVWTLVFAVGGIWWPPHRDEREYTWSVLDHLVGNLYVWAALVLAGWAATRLLRDGTRSRVASADDSGVESAGLRT